MNQTNDKPGSNLLTHSRMACLRRCPRQHFLRYELGLTRDREDMPLRMGIQFHKGIEAASKPDATTDSIYAVALDAYETIPEWADPVEWAVERATCANLLAGHIWRYGNDSIKTIRAEQTFQIPLINPETHAESRTFQLAGKIDAIQQLPDGRQAIGEVKTTGEDIDPNGDYWLRLRCDPQISLYFLAARVLGWDVSCILYDATKRPGIRPKQVNTLDDAGKKIVLDSQGERVFKKSGEPRESGDTEKGYILQSRVETPDEYGARLLASIQEKPDFYYQRREIPRLDDELAAFQLEVWQQAKQLMEMRRYGRWFRNVGRWTCPQCDFKDLCLNNVKIEPGVAPDGFKFSDSVHPELELVEKE